MHQVVEAHFDDVTVEKLSIARNTLYKQGYSVELEGKPHISLASFANSSIDAWKKNFDTIDLSEQLQIEFSYIGVFAGEACVVFMGVTPTQTLYNLQRHVHRTAVSAATDLHELYAPDRIIFHSTLAGGVKRVALGAVTDLVTGLDLPKTAILTKLALVRYFPALELHSLSIV